MYHRLDLVVFPCLFIHGEMHHVLQTLDIDILRVGSFEQIDKDALGQCICVCDRTFERTAREAQERLQSCCHCARRFELL